jgi:hypothetical protein
MVFTDMLKQSPRMQAQLETLFIDRNNITQLDVHTLGTLKVASLNVP